MCVCVWWECLRYILLPWLMELSGQGQLEPVLQVQSPGERQPIHLSHIDVSLSLFPSLPSTLSSNQRGEGGFPKVRINKRQTNKQRSCQLSSSIQYWIINYSFMDSFCEFVFLKLPFLLSLPFCLFSFLPPFLPPKYPGPISHIVRGTVVLRQM